MTEAVSRPIEGICPICRQRRRLEHIVFVPAAEGSSSGTLWLCSMACVNLFFDYL